MPNYSHCYIRGYLFSLLINVYIIYFLLSRFLFYFMLTCMQTNCGLLIYIQGEHFGDSVRIPLLSLHSCNIVQPVHKTHILCKK